MEEVERLGNLLQLADRVWVLPGGVNIGVLAGEDDQFILVDTGLNETSAKKALKAVREELGGQVGCRADHARPRRPLWWQRCRREAYRGDRLRSAIR